MERYSKKIYCIGKLTFSTIRIWLKFLPVRAGNLKFLRLKFYTEISAFPMVNSGFLSLAPTEVSPQWWKGENIGSVVEWWTRSPLEQKFVGSVPTHGLNFGLFLYKIFRTGNKCLKQFFEVFTLLFCFLIEPQLPWKLFRNFYFFENCHFFLHQTHEKIWSKNFFWIFSKMYEIL